jgi:hypothetical protein
MLVVISSAHDSMAMSAVEAWAAWGAALCTPADLSCSGWRHHVGRPREDVAVVSGALVPASRITGVLIRLPLVRPEMLAHIHPSDREYVATEMTSFLIAFVSSLRCRVLNRASSGSLSGPAWRPEQWLRAAANAGIPVRPLHRIIVRNGVVEPDLDLATSVTLIGARVFGSADPVLARWARVLAQASGVGMLGLSFTNNASGFALATIDPMPELDSPDKLDAAREFLVGDVLDVDR